MSSEKRQSHDMPELHQVESLAENGSIAIKESDLEKPPAPGADYSGAIKKTDPKEIVSNLPTYFSLLFSAF